MDKVAEMTESEQNEPLPYYKWLWRDWRANIDVQLLDYVARGLYRSLLDEQWCEGKVPTDSGRRALLCGCPPEVMEKYWPVLAPFFEEDEDGNLVNWKLEKQRTASDKKRAALARNGKKGGRGNKAIALDPKASVPDPKSIFPIAEQSRAETEQSISEQETDPDFQNEDEDMSKSSLKKQFQFVAGKYKTKAGGFDSTWTELDALAKSRSVAELVRDFEEYLKEYQGDDFPNGAAVVYLRAAPYRLEATAPTVTAAKDPEVVGVARELTHLSDGSLTFTDKHRVRLGEVVKEFSAPEVVSSFKTWLQDQDLNDAKNVSYLPGKFVQIVDGLIYSARKRKEETAAAEISRAAAVKRLQEEAEAERASRPVEPDFDPLADLEEPVVQ